MILSDKYSSRITGSVRSAVNKYDMISDGDRIAVGLSGGKDSLVLLAALADLSAYYPVKYELRALTLDPMFGSETTDYSGLAGFCDTLGIEHVIIRGESADRLFAGGVRNPCSLCSKLRRAALCETAVKLGCNKLALGHNADDTAQTVLMNLIRSGRYSCFEPVTYYPDKDLSIIRPLAETHEKDIASAAKRACLPVVPSSCPMDKNSERERIAQIIASSGGSAAVDSIIHSLQTSRTDGWK